VIADVAVGAVILGAIGWVIASITCVDDAGGVDVPPWAIAGIVLLVVVVAAIFLWMSFEIGRWVLSR
jgi:protein-S-isoprenylcysteine O-methyltransferase Ste14